MASLNRFNSVKIEHEDSREAVLKCRLEGFNPKKHTCNAEVRDNTLYVEATMDGNDFRYTIGNIGVENRAVAHKASNGQIEVRITKPDPEYSLASRLPRI